MIARISVLIVCILLAGQWVRGREPSPVALAAPLASIPMNIGPWRGAEGTPLEPDVERVLGADDYLNRIYAHPDGPLVGLWVAFYAAQRQGDAIHSPLHCLPGTGWEIVERSRPLIQVNGHSRPVNQYVVRRRGERLLVTYWFQGRGRIVASEYANKAYLLADAVRWGRTDGALVRVSAPLRGDRRPAHDATEAFIAAFHPELSGRLP